MTVRTRALVVGGGIAGVAAGYALAPHADVTLAERESTLAYHSTGRSAALYFENYGDESIRPLTKASRGFFDAPPDGLADTPLLSRRGALTIAREEFLGELAQIEATGRATATNIERLATHEALDICPVVKPEAVAAALWEPDAADMDVAAIHQAFVRGLNRRGATIARSAELVQGTRKSTEWVVELSSGAWRGDLIVNAAGAWGDVVAERCGVEPIGIEPRRRTAFMVQGTEESADWPLVVEVRHEFYFKSDGEQILCSLADQTRTEPCDARPREIDVALAIDRINEATTLGIRSVRSQWAGLRTFAADGGMAIGPDPAMPEFVWLVGQGGTGIQTAPAAGQLTAALALGDAVPQALLDRGFVAEGVGVARFRT